MMVVNVRLDALEVARQLDAAGALALDGIIEPRSVWVDTDGDLVIEVVIREGADV